VYVYKLYLLIYIIWLYTWHATDSVVYLPTGSKAQKKEASNSNSRNKILSNLKDFSNSVKGDQQIACKMAVTGLTRAGKSRFYVF